jgi:hypothetical membrane protein
VSRFWRKYIFDAVAWGCGLFFVLTLLAMLTYSGGAAFNPDAPGYQFTRNFFSDLGRTVSYSGQPNLLSAILFFFALSLAGFGLVLFFLAFPRFFMHRSYLRVLSLAGSLLGVLAGLCFIGVAFTPANLSREAHIQFVMWAFCLLPLAIFLYTVALFLNRAYPRRYAWLFVAFWLLLTGYYLLLSNGPGIDTPQGFVIQVVGQKIIGYASVVCIGLQALGARKMVE